MQRVGAGSKMGIGEARMRCEFSIKTDGSYWVGYLKALHKFKFGPNNRHEIPLDYATDFCSKKGICVLCLGINQGRVHGANEGHYC
eukprot:2491495-Prymnesium_polylepis.1